MPASRTERAGAREELGAGGEQRLRAPEIRPIDDAPLDGTGVCVSMARRCAGPATGACRVRFCVADDIEIRPPRHPSTRQPARPPRARFASSGARRAGLGAYLARIADVGSRAEQAPCSWPSSAASSPGRHPRARFADQPRTQRAAGTGRGPPPHARRQPRAPRTWDRAPAGARLHRARTRARQAADHAGHRPGAWSAAQQLYMSLGFTADRSAPAPGGPQLLGYTLDHRLGAPGDTLGSSRARRLREGRERASRHQAVRAPLRDRGRPDHAAARRGARGEHAHRPALRRHPARQRRHRRRGDRRSLADRQGQPAATAAARPLPGDAAARRGAAAAAGAPRAGPGARRRARPSLPGAERPGGERVPPPDARGGGTAARRRRAPQGRAHRHRRVRDRIARSRSATSTPRATRRAATCAPTSSSRPPKDGTSTSSRAIPCRARFGPSGSIGSGRRALLPSTFAVPDDFDIDTVLGAAWAIWQGAGGDRVVLRFTPEARQWVDETPVACAREAHRSPRRRDRGAPRCRRRGGDAPLADAMGPERRGARTGVAAPPHRGDATPPPRHCMRRVPPNGVKREHHGREGHPHRRRVASAPDA